MCLCLGITELTWRINIHKLLEIVVRLRAQKSYPIFVHQIARSCPSDIRQSDPPMCSVSFKPPMVKLVTVCTLGRVEPVIGGTISILLVLEIARTESNVFDACGAVHPCGRYPELLATISS
jgi:hypothetical protein